MAAKSKQAEEQAAEGGKPKHIPGSGASERFVAQCATHGRLSETTERKSRAFARAEGHHSACPGEVSILEVVK